MFKRAAIYFVQFFDSDMWPHVKHAVACFKHEAERFKNATVYLNVRAHVL